VPDSIVLEDESELSRPVGQYVFREAGHSDANSANQLSGLTGSGVRIEPLNCPAPSDKPLVSLLPLKRRDKRSSDSNAVRVIDISTRRERLIRWLLTAEEAKRDGDNIDILIRITPVNYRFVGYEEVVEEIVKRRGTISAKPWRPF
jgi:hypothetical protein